MTDIENALRSQLKSAVDRVPEPSHGLADRIEVRGNQLRRRRRSGRCVLAGAAMAALVGGAMVVGTISGSDTQSIQSAAAPVPDVLGQDLGQAARTLAGVGLGLSLDEGSATAQDAVVVAQRPSPGVTATSREILVSAATSAPPGATQCPDAVARTTGDPDVLPAAGNTTLERVQDILASSGTAMVQQFNAVRTELASRNGEVWRKLPSGDVTTDAVADFQIVVVLAGPDACPAAPASYNGVPLAFVPEG